jgi:hypothetical protein
VTVAFQLTLCCLVATAVVGCRSPAAQSAWRPADKVRRVLVRERDTRTPCFLWQHASKWRTDEQVLLKSADIFGTALGSSSLVMVGADPTGQLWVSLGSQSGDFDAQPLLGQINGESVVGVGFAIPISQDLAVLGVKRDCSSEECISYAGISRTEGIKWTMPGTGREMVGAVALSNGHWCAVTETNNSALFCYRGDGSPLWKQSLDDVHTVMSMTESGDNLGIAAIGTNRQAHLLTFARENGTAVDKTPLGVSSPLALAPDGTGGFWVILSAWLGTLTLPCPVEASPLRYYLAHLDRRGECTETFDIGAYASLHPASVSYSGSRSFLQVAATWQATGVELLCLETPR